MKRKYLSHRIDRSENIDNLDPFEVQERKFDITDKRNKKLKSKDHQIEKTSKNDRDNTIELIETSEELKSGIEKIKNLKKSIDDFDKDVYELKKDPIKINMQNPINQLVNNKV